MSKTTPMAVKFTPGVRERLQALGKARRRTPHWLMVEAVRVYLEREEEIERGKFEAREALARYDATGEYVADENVRAWLETWGQTGESKAPARVRRARAR